MHLRQCLVPDDRCAPRAVRHNGATQHLQKLLRHTLELLHWVDKRAGSAAEATNALVFARVVLKHLTESLTGPQLAEFVNAPLARGAGQAAPKGVHGGLPVLAMPCPPYQNIDSLRSLDRISSQPEVGYTPRKP